MAITHDQGTVERIRRGPSLHFKQTMPEGKPAAVVGLIHGYAEHVGRYAHVMDAWAEKGIATVGIDLRGHGRSEGRRGHCDRFTEYLDDAAELRTLVTRRVPDAPPFLFGHSFGGLVSLRSVLEDPTPWRALALSAPYMKNAVQASPAKLFLGKVLSGVWPTLTLSSGLHGKDVTLDAGRARAFDEDPLVFPTVTTRWYSEALASQAYVLEHARSLTLPLFVLVGTKDKVADMSGGRALFDAASSVDKTWDLREGYFHEALNDPEWRPVADRIADWILAHAHGLSDGSKAHEPLAGQ
jgi:alpha-beta hydrolase superfamily lysophospholipase